METRWLTYEELGSALGIAPASAKRLAIRKKWAKKLGNDGKSRIAVPVERLEAVPPVTGDNPSDISGDNTSDIPGDDTEDKGDTLSVVTVLSRHIERLEKELDATRAKLETVEQERDRERQKASELEREAASAQVLRMTVDSLKTALEAEKQLRSEIRQDRDRWSAAAEAFQQQLVGLTSKPSRGFFGWLKRA